MFFLIFYLCLFSFSLHATHTLDVKENDSKLLNRQYFMGDENLKNEGVISLSSLSDPLEQKVFFSGKEVNFQKEKSVLGKDERKIVAGDSCWEFPAACIASLKFCYENFTNFGTGFLIAPRYMLTASHHLNIEESSIKSITCYFGRYKNYVKDYCDVEGFTLHKPLKDQELVSYSLLLLKKPMGQKVGYLNPILCDLHNQWIYIQGYPARYYDEQKDECVNNVCQYKSYSKEISVQENYLFYSIKTTSGQSGSPIFIRNEKDKNYVSML